MPNITETNDSKYEEDVVKSNIPVLAYFKSEWCPSCKRISPVVDAVSGMYKDKVRFVKIDVTANIKTAEQNNVLSIPTLLFVKTGKETARNIGYISENGLKSFVDKNL